MGAWKNAGFMNTERKLKRPGENKKKIASVPLRSP
jgi:hypothetical protein